MLIPIDPLPYKGDIGEFLGSPTDRLVTSFPPLSTNGLVSAWSGGRSRQAGCSRCQGRNQRAGAGRQEALDRCGSAQWFGAVAWSAGKSAFVRDENGSEKTLDVPSTVGALALAPSGLRLAVAHYSGVTLWFPNMAGTEEFLPWADRILR